MSLVDWPKPAEPCPPAPFHHVPDPEGDYCHYGWISSNETGEPIWCLCDCEDPADPWPPHGPTDGPRDCTCYHCMRKPRRDRGFAMCEYANHHCDSCHVAGSCTTLACRGKML